MAMPCPQHPGLDSQEKGEMTSIPHPHAQNIILLDMKRLPPLPPLPLGHKTVTLALYLNSPPVRAGAQCDGKKPHLQASPVSLVGVRLIISDTGVAR